MGWYKIVADEVHKSKEHTTQVIYIWGSDINEVLSRYRRLSAVPRSTTPNIRKLDDNEVSLLEQAIVRDRRWDVEKAKKSVVRYSHIGDKLPPV